MALAATAPQVILAAYSGLSRADYDTLSKIAKKHGTTAKAVRAANALTSDKINVGQKLKIPSKGAAAETADPAAKTLTVPEPTAAPFPATLPTPGTGR